MRKTLKKAKTPSSVEPAPVAIPVVSSPSPRPSRSRSRASIARPATVQAQAEGEAADKGKAKGAGKGTGKGEVEIEGGVETVIPSEGRAEQVVVPRPMTAQEAESAAAADVESGKGEKVGKNGRSTKNVKNVKTTKTAKPRVRAKRQPSSPEPVESLADVRAELADLTIRIGRERQVRCLPGQDFPLDSATGRLIKADIERLRGIDPAAVTGADALPYLVDLRDVCRRLLAEVCLGDSPNRRQAVGRTVSKVGRQMMPREHFTCLDGPATPPLSPDEAASL